MNPQKTQTHQDCMILMSRFTSHRRKQWKNWGALKTPCDFCGAGIDEPCMNMNEARKGNQVRCQNAHEGRVDWERVLEGLQKRGLAGG